MSVKVIQPFGQFSHFPPFSSWVAVVSFRSNSWLEVVKAEEIRKRGLVEFKFSGNEEILEIMGLIEIA